MPVHALTLPDTSTGPCAQVAARLGRFLDVAPAGFHRSAGEERNRLNYVSPLDALSASAATRATLAAEVARDDAESGEWTRRLCGGVLR